MRGTLVRAVVTTGVLAGLLVPLGFTQPAEAATSFGFVKDDGKLLGWAQFNSGLHGYHHETSNAGVNAFDIIDWNCDDGKEVGVTWKVGGSIKSAKVDDCERNGGFDFRVSSIKTGQAWSTMKSMSWVVWVEDSEGHRQYGKRFVDDWMGSYSRDKGNKYAPHTSIYKEDGGKKIVASLWPSKMMAEDANGDLWKPMWDDMMARTPVPDSLTDDQVESMQKQLYCHALWGWTGKAGPTWDLESTAPNIPWDEAGQVQKHRCNWGGDEQTHAYWPTNPPDEPPTDRSPIVNAGEDRSGQEGSRVSLDGSAVDDKGTPELKWTYQAVKGVDKGTSCEFSSAGKTGTGFACTDDGTFKVTLTADDGVNPPVSDSALVRLKNVAPKLTLRSPEDWDVHRVEDDVSVEATFTDPGSNDTHTCTTTWDDGSRSACDKSHSFEHAGMFTTKTTVADDDGGSDSVDAMAVVYDPRAGLLTGLGSVDGLGFTTIAKYVSASSTKPVGTVTLDLPGKHGRHTIVSTDLEWLVITPDGKAAVKGRGVDHGFVGYAEGGRFRGVVWPLSEGDVPPDDRGNLSHDTSPGASWDLDEAELKPVDAGLMVIDSGWIPGLPL